MHATARTRRRPNTSASRTVAAIMRNIAHRSPRLRPQPQDFVCSRTQCDVAWRGEEADCWNCGLPATYRRAYAGSALQRLLAAVDPDRACKSGARS